MTSVTKTAGITAVTCLVIGFLLGFIPEYMAKSRVESRVVELNGESEAASKSLGHTQSQLKLSEFAVKAAVVSADAQTNNYADASASASSLFTELRKYVETANDSSTRSQIQSVLSMRDTTIAGLAKADPAVRPVLAKIFSTLKPLSSQTKS